MKKYIIATEKNLGELRQWPGKIRAYKVVRENGSPPSYCYKKWAIKIRYFVGKTSKCRNPNLDERVACGKGLHVATNKWCREVYKHHLKRNYRLLVVEFMAKDIAAIPYSIKSFYNKFRVRKFTVIEDRTETILKRKQKIY